jgi:hypothetical protein
MLKNAPRKIVLSVNIKITGFDGEPMHSTVINGDPYILLEDLGNALFHSSAIDETFQDVLEPNDCIDILVLDTPLAITFVNIVGIYKLAYNAGPTQGSRFVEWFKTVILKK